MTDVLKTEVQVIAVKNQAWICFEDAFRVGSYFPWDGHIHVHVTWSTSNPELKLFTNL